MTSRLLDNSLFCSHSVPLVSILVFLSFLVSPLSWLSSCFIIVSVVLFCVFCVCVEFLFLSHYVSCLQQLCSHLLPFPSLSSVCVCVCIEYWFAPYPLLCCPTLLCATSLQALSLNIWIPGSISIDLSVDLSWTLFISWSYSIKSWFWPFFLSPAFGFSFDWLHSWVMTL